MELSPRIMRMTHRQRRGGDQINRTLAGEWLTAGHFSAPPPAQMCHWCWVENGTPLSDFDSNICLPGNTPAARLLFCSSPSRRSFSKSFARYLMSTFDRDESLPSRNVPIESSCKGCSLNHVPKQLLSSGDSPHFHYDLRWADVPFQMSLCSKYKTVTCMLDITHYSFKNIISLHRVCHFN